MKFPNAYNGVSKIYLAEILAIVGALCIGVGAILALAGVGAATVATEGAAAAAEGAATAAGEGVGVGLAVGGGIFVMAAGVIMIISYILNIIGVSAASKDEEGFKNALIAIIVGIIVSVVGAFFSKNGTISVICQIVNKVCEVLIFWFCISGIENLAVRLGDRAVSEKAESLAKLILGVYAISIILSVISIFVKFSSFVAGLISVIGVVCMIVAYLMYLSLLANAKRMLARS